MSERESEQSRIFLIYFSFFISLFLLGLTACTIFIRISYQWLWFNAGQTKKKPLARTTCIKATTVDKQLKHGEMINKINFYENLTKLVLSHSGTRFLIAARSLLAHGSTYVIRTANESVLKIIFFCLLQHCWWFFFSFGTEQKKCNLMRQLINQPFNFSLFVICMISIFLLLFLWHLIDRTTNGLQKMWTKHTHTTNKKCMSSNRFQVDCCDLN